MTKAKNNGVKNLKPFKKGEDSRRNKKGRPTKLPALDVLLADLLGKADTRGATQADKILLAMAKKALNGDVRAAELILSRAYGKAKEKVEIEHSGAVEQVVVQHYIHLPKRRDK